MHALGVIAEGAIAVDVDFSFGVLTAGFEGLEVWVLKKKSSRVETLSASPKEGASDLECASCTCLEVGGAAIVVVSA